MATNTQAITVADNRKQIVSLITSDTFKGQLTAALMKRLDPEFVMRAALSYLNSNADLAECNPVSVAACVLQIAQAGLAPEPWKGHAYLIPRKMGGFEAANRGGPRKTCTFLIGYRGYVHLAYRAPKVNKAAANPVYEGDVFHLNLADGAVAHEPWVKATKDAPKRGEFIGAYALVKLDNGETLVEWMTKEDIDKVRARSQASGSGPWVTDYVEMARKTPFRRLFKWVPDETLQKVAAMEEAQEFGKTSVTVDSETGEIIVTADDNEEPPSRPIVETGTLSVDKQLSTLKESSEPNRGHGNEGMVQNTKKPDPLPTEGFSHDGKNAVRGIVLKVTPPREFKKEKGSSWSVAIEMAKDVAGKDVKLGCWHRSMHQYLVPAIEGRVCSFVIAQNKGYWNIEQILRLGEQEFYEGVPVIDANADLKAGDTGLNDPPPPSDLDIPAGSDLFGKR